MFALDPSAVFLFPAVNPGRSAWPAGTMEVEARICFEN